MDDSHLDQMVQHERSYTGSSPFRVRENVGNVSFIIRNIGHHEGETDDQVTVENHAAKVWVFQAFCHCQVNKLSFISLKDLTGKTHNQFPTRRIPCTWH